MMATDVNMPCGITRGCHMSPVNTIFKGPCGQVEKCHVEPPSDAMWHHPESAMCHVKDWHGGDISDQVGQSEDSMWPNQQMTRGTPETPKEGS
jgi:hypothetical protein